MSHRPTAPPARLHRVFRRSPRRPPVGYRPHALHDATAPAYPDCRETREATYSLPICSWSKLGGGVEFGIDLFIMQIDGIEAIFAKFMEKRHPSKSSHSCGLPRTQLSQLKELGGGKKPHFSRKLLLGHF